MAYGTVKIDFITFDNGGIDQTITVSGIANSLSGSVEVTGLVSGLTGVFDTVTGTTRVAGGALVPLDSTVPSVGMYLPTGDTIGFATNGTDQLQINSQGYINASNLASSGIALNIRRDLSGSATTAGISSVCFNTATTAANTYGVYSFITPTPSGSLASPNVHIYYAAGDSGSAYTIPAAQYGYYADSSITQGLSNFGFFSAVPSGTNKYGFYESRGATNVFLGDVGIGTGTPTAKLEVSGNTKLVGDVQVSSVNSGPLAGFRNAIINGNFDFWARGTNQTTSGYGSADRWSTNFSGSSCVVSRQPFVLGQTVVPGEPQFHYKAEVTSVTGVNNYALLSQRIEGVRTFAGQEVTVSFWAKADSNRNISVDLSQLFGTGGSPSPDVQGIGASKYAITPTWTKITLTTTMPSISGMSLGTNDDDVVRLRIWFDAGSNYDSHTDTLGQQSGNFFISRVQLEPGPVATPFEQRPIGIEQQLCYRYYFRIDDGTEANTFLGIGGNGSQYAGGVQVVGFGNATLPVPMRAIPTVTHVVSTYVNCATLTLQPYKTHIRSATTSLAAGIVNCSTDPAVPFELDAEL